MSLLYFVKKPAILYIHSTSALMKLRNVTFKRNNSRMGLSKGEFSHPFCYVKAAYESGAKLQASMEIHAIKFPTILWIHFRKTGSFHLHAMNFPL